MHFPFRALLSGFAIWFLWVSLILAAIEVVPAATIGSSLFGAARLIALALLAIGFAALYRRWAGPVSLQEGVLVGVSWLAMMIALDMAHYVMVPFDIGAYFRAGTPLPYLMLPVISALVLSGGGSRPAPLRSA